MTPNDYELQSILEDEPSGIPLFYYAIVQKQMGRLAHYLLYEQRFPHIQQSRDSLKLTFGQALIDLRQLAIKCGYDPVECEDMGMENLRERIRDFKKDGWAKVE